MGYKTAYNRGYKSPYSPLVASEEEPPSGQMVYNTPGTFQLVVPDGVTDIQAECWGGGGGGGQTSGTSLFAGGASGGGYASGVLGGGLITAGSTINIVVGGGGVGAAPFARFGAPGVLSRVYLTIGTTLVSGLGGEEGDGSGTYGQAKGGTTHASVTSPVVHLSSDGGPSFGPGASVGGKGADPEGGAGGSFSFETGIGENGVAPGGGGAGTGGNAGVKGGDGAAGRVRLTWPPT